MSCVEPHPDERDPPGRREKWRSVLMLREKLARPSWISRGRLAPFCMSMAGVGASQSAAQEPDGSRSSCPAFRSQNFSIDLSR